MTICDSFPLPRIKEALQAVKAAVWFTSFDLAQGYLQLAMDEVQIFTRLCSGQGHQGYMSLLICHLVCPMQVLVSVV